MLREVSLLIHYLCNSSKYEARVQTDHDRKIQERRLKVGPLPKHMYDSTFVYCTKGVWCYVFSTDNRILYQFLSLIFPNLLAQHNIAHEKQVRKVIGKSAWFVKREEASTKQ